MYLNTYPKENPKYLPFATLSPKMNNKNNFLSGAQKRKRAAEEKEKIAKLPKLTSWLNSGATTAIHTTPSVHIHPAQVVMFYVYGCLMPGHTLQTVSYLCSGYKLVLLQLLPMAPTMNRAKILKEMLLVSTLHAWYRATHTPHSVYQLLYNPHLHAHSPPAASSPPPLHLLQISWVSSCSQALSIVQWIRKSDGTGSLVQNMHQVYHNLLRQLTHQTHDSHIHPQYDMGKATSHSFTHSVLSLIPHCIHTSIHSQQGVQILWNFLLFCQPLCNVLPHQLQSRNISIFYLHTRLGCLQVVFVHYKHTTIATWD